ncbi:MAG: chromosome segregation protein SMC [Oscillospiraceae bacterium]|nr:chromosome segregation protein SMC [Candidatus Ruminococcus equi]
MLLKSLELQGFKTFPDKTKLTFDTGITSVVGPNGSGKSNISDAIRWVLGEQSPKSLRCSRMEDVVFNGTDSRKRQGYAEVTLTIDNKDRLLPYNGDDVSVTRRYYRSGESEYLINKASVRLKDIHELFMDTGLGRDGYSMIGQGKIDSIVASKSEDRREIFEEAAGISRYRYRKTEAERKLIHTEENLVRLKDIVTELEDRVGPLKTQSEKAEKFLEYAGEKRGLEIALWLDTLNKSSSTLKEHEDKISVAKNQYDEAETALQNISSETTEIYLKKGEISSKIEEIRNEITQIEGEISFNRSSLSVAENDILHNKENITRIESEIERAKNSSEDIQNDIYEKEKRIELLEKAVENTQSAYNETADKLNNINTDSSRSSEELEKLSSVIATLSKQSADARVTDMTSASTVIELEGRVENLKENCSSKRELLEDTALMEKDYKEKVKSAEEKVQSLLNTVTGLEMKMKSRLEKRDELKANADKLNLDAEEKSRRAKLLSDLARNYEGFYNSVKVVMKEAEKGALGGICGPVSSLIRVPKEYNIAIETALGSKMQNIITKTDEDAKRAMSLLKKRDAGRATFLPITTIKPRTLDEKGLDECYGYIGIADKLCTCDKKYADIMSSLLGRIVVAEDLNSAAKIAKQYSYRFMVVTLDGQVINAGGSFTGGSLTKKSGLLSRESEIESLNIEAEKLKEKAKSAFDEYKKAQETYAKYEADLLGIRADLSTAQQELVRLQAELSACTNELNNIRITVTEIEREITSLQSKIEQAKVMGATAKKVLQKYTAEIETHELKIRELTGNREELSQKRERLSEELQELRLEIVTMQKDIENIRTEIELSRKSGENQDELIKELEGQISVLVENNSQLELKIQNINTQIELLQQKVVAKNEEIANNNDFLDELEKRSVELRTIERDKNTERELASNEYSRLEERKINLQKQFDDIISKLWEEYELTRREAEEQAVEIEDLSKAKQRLTELKQKIKSLGNVNVSAIEEYKEVSERYEFMKTQVDDVETSKKEIESLIVELTKQMKDVFVTSFAEINKNFSETFKELFGGGTASLELTNPEEILTSGIDIIVHPPGKIVVHLEALSGGEKALVAIALYFAIMKVRPAPFCVMDEIEAALDEVNVDRFAKYLRNLTDDTQFILITHRRGTMEEADVLYGVTMQDEGISKLLELRASEVASKLGIKA